MTIKNLVQWKKKNNIITKIFGCDKELKWNQSEMNF